MPWEGTLARGDVKNLTIRDHGDLQSFDISDGERNSILILKLRLPIQAVETTTTIPMLRRASLHPPHVHLLDPALPSEPATITLPTPFPLFFVLTPSHWGWGMSSVQSRR